MRIIERNEMKKNIVSLLLILFLCISCSSLGFVTSKSLQDIQNGMTPQEVSSVMRGGPDYRRFVNGREQWEYRRYNTNNERIIVLINFYDGHVVGLDSFPDMESNRQDIQTHRLKDK